MSENYFFPSFHKFIRLLLLVILLGISGTFIPVSAQDNTAPSESDGATAESGGTTAGADNIPTSEAAINAGAGLFQGNCTVCHAINEVVIGPALKNVHQQHELPWLINFIRNSQEVIQSGDEYAVNLYNEYNKTLMPAFDYSDEEITNILAYIKSESQASVASLDSNDATDATDATGAAAQDRTPLESDGGAGVAGSDNYLSTILIGLVVVLGLILVVLILIVVLLTRFLNKKEDLDEEDQASLTSRFDVGGVVQSRAFIGIMLFVFMAIVGKLVLDGLFSIGVQQGYQPPQPIAFSHALHAGKYEIQCQYCHTGVMKGKSANIPAANICMNCHQQIKTESPEIQKIYAAIDFDKESQTYGMNKKPIEWVRVHNLPDLAYFNHAQHVNVGGLACQTCHGEVQEMEVVYQHTKLTMGWCINCHRETQVNAAGNAYYDKLLELHNSTNPGEPMRVEDIGGLECSKCHY